MGPKSSLISLSIAANYFNFKINVQRSALDEGGESLNVEPQVNMEEEKYYP